MDPVTTAESEPEPIKAADPKPPRAKRSAGNGSALIDLLKRPEGASIAEIQANTGWLSHTARAAISTQGKKAGLTITSEKEEGRGRVYRAK